MCSSDLADVFTYQLVAGKGDTNNADFTILSDLLLTAKIFNHDFQDTAYVRLRTMDANGHSLDTTFSILILQDATGINSGMGPGSFRVYPNPASGMVTVEIPGTSNGAYRLRLFDISGKILLEQSDLEDSRVEFSSEHIAPGVYFLELRGEELFRTKLIIDR